MIFPSKDRLIYYIIPVLTIGLLYFVWYAWRFYEVYAAGKPEPGIYGDQFGGLNTLFTGWAFVILIVTLIAQMFELRLQRKELEETREQIKGERKALEKSSKFMESQANIMLDQIKVDSFYRLVSLHREIVNKQKYKQYDGEGIPAFRNAYDWLAQTKSTLEPMDALIAFYENNLIDFKSFFLLTERILDYIDTEITDIEHYKAIFNAIISEHERYILLHYEICYPGTDLHRLLNKYIGFHSINFERLPEWLSDANIYNKHPALPYWIK